MNILVACPSRGRPEILLRNTLNWLGQTGADWGVWVEEPDVKAYDPVVGAAHLHVLPEQRRGLGYAKRQIATYAVEHGYDVVFKVDDDVEYWSPGHGHPTDNRRDTARLLSGMHRRAETTFETYPALGAIGFQYKNFMHIQSTPVWSLNVRLQGLYYIYAADILAEPGDGDPFEDFYSTLCLWLQTRYTMRFNRLGFYCGGAKNIGINPGGYADLDRVARAQRALTHFRALYPPLPIKTVTHAWRYEPDMVAISKQLFGERKP